MITARMINPLPGVAMMATMKYEIPENIEISGGAHTSTPHVGLPTVFEDIAFVKVILREKSTFLSSNFLPKTILRTLTFI